MATTRKKTAVKTQSQPDKAQISSQRWRTFVVAFLVTLGSIALLNWLIVRWTEKYLLTTSNWVATVAPLSKDETVASAVSQYAVSNLYSSIDLQAKIKEALPDKAQFLAAPLADQVVKTSEQVGTKVITSDQFASVWQSSNEITHTKLVTALRKPAGEQASIGADQKVLGVDISPLIQRIRDRIGSSEVAPQPDAKAAVIAVNLKSRFDQARLAVQFTDAMYQVLIFVVLACYLGALAVARNRWKTMLAISLTITVITALELIAMKAIRPEVISQVASQYQAAVGVVWDAFTKGFITVANNAMIIGIGLTIVTILAGPYAWARQLRHLVALDRLPKTRLAGWVRTGREALRHYVIGLRIAGLVVAFGYLILSAAITWQTVVVVIFSYLIYLAIVELCAARTHQVTNRVAAAK